MSRPFSRAGVGYRGVGLLGFMLTLFASQVLGIRVEGRTRHHKERTWPRTAVISNHIVLKARLDTSTRAFPAVPLKKSGTTGDLPHGGNRRFHAEP
jgi:hypothetical protein